MALIKCKECGGEVSTKAAACPKCGAKVPPKTSAVTWFVAVIFGIGVIGAFSNHSDSGPSSDSHQSAVTAAPVAAAPACASDDIQCFGKDGIIAAGVYCQEPIERLAKHEVKWTDTWAEFKFSRLKWKDKEKGIITYIGDKAMFQNGFGAFNPVTYFCDLDKDNKTVLAVSVIDGRLPN